MKLVKISLLILIIPLLVVLRARTVNAQGFVHCNIGGFGTCTLDLLVSPNPNCEAEYTIPPCGDFFVGDCCNAQPPENCQNIACITTLTPTPTSTPSGSECDSGYYCEHVGGGAGNTQATCELAGGIYESCVTRDGSDTGNCCLPGVDTYFCSGNGSSECSTELTVGYGCGANWGPCPPGDDSCTSCDEISPSSCGPSILAGPFPCVEQNDTIGYKCDSVTLGCYPCFEGDTVYNCNPPEYSIEDFGSSQEAYTNCFLACSGQIGTRYSCNGQQSCVENGAGEFETLGQCDCSTALLIFCDSEGNITRTPSGTLWTAIGCIPIVDSGGNLVSTEFSKFWLTIGLSMAGGIALVIIALAGILIKMSAGNPERMRAAKALLMAALTGLFLLIFSVYLLRVMGVNILGIANLAG